MPRDWYLMVHEAWALESISSLSDEAIRFISCRFGVSGLTSMGVPVREQGTALVLQNVYILAAAESSRGKPTADMLVALLEEEFERRGVLPFRDDDVTSVEALSDDALRYVTAPFGDLFEVDRLRRRCAPSELRLCDLLRHALAVGPTAGPEAVVVATAVDLELERRGWSPRHAVVT